MKAAATHNTELACLVSYDIYGGCIITFLEDNAAFEYLIKKALPIFMAATHIARIIRKCCKSTFMAWENTLRSPWYPRV